MAGQLLEFITDYWFTLLITSVIAYFLGSINFAIVITKIFYKTDIRESGSGNAGATNVLRKGKLPAALTTIGDLGKSIFSVLLGGFIVVTMSSGHIGTEIIFSDIGKYLAGLFCILGHLYPVYFGFRGGKGVLTTLGMMLILDWRVALLCLTVFAISVALFRMVSLGSICAGIALPIFTGLFSAFFHNNPIFNTVFSTAITLMISTILIIKHAPNIKRIINKTENKIGSKAS